MEARLAAIRKLCWHLRYSVPRRIRHWIDPFEKYKFEANLERQRRKAIAFGLLYGWPQMSPEETKAVVVWINGAVPREQAAEMDLHIGRIWQRRRG